ncbi:pseudouridine kinase isoform X2 [Macadamia integrifolia]|uniref:pseudouridine kinase isoform X2 n=1 Tax=Macadamia integrifolia TaxID=60698 RepID=UPI001C4F87CF|nr:pseudouridine kinase isoform X2 [Macadamia integrifolia]
MENSAGRRLNTLIQHLLLQDKGDVQVLLPNELREGRSKNVKSEPVIIGGMILDIHAYPSIPATPRTTTPGKVHYVLGGVARNIADCMSKLGAKPFMISAVGPDMAGNLLLEHWESVGLSTEGILRCQGIETPVVCNVFDANGELAAAVASAEAIEKFLAKEWIKQFTRNIHSAPILMVDANLSQRSLEASCQTSQSGIPVWFEPVSVAKSKRVASIIKYVTFTSPNEDELIAMANAVSSEDLFLPIQRVDNGGSTQSIESFLLLLKPAIWVLLEKGVKLVVVTLGSDGVFLCSKGGAEFTAVDFKNTESSHFGKLLSEMVTLNCQNDLVNFCKFNRSSTHLSVVHFPALPASVVGLTGAGDCLVGGTLASLSAGLDMMQSMAVGMATAKAAVETRKNVPSEFCLASIADDAKRVYSSARVVFDQSVV